MMGLKPCPFCGASLEINGTYALHPTSGTFCFLSNARRPLVERFPRDGVWISPSADLWNTRTDAILSDPRVMALVDAASSALLFMDEDFGSHSDGQPQREGLRAALAAIAVKP